jgi:hypothetical protein
MHTHSLQPIREFMVLAYLTLPCLPTTADDSTVPMQRAPRLTVSEDLSHPASVEGRLSAVCHATNSEDLDAFLDCFTASTGKKLRKPAAIMFVQHDVAMELIDHTIIEQSENRAQAAVKYATTRSGRRYTVFSIVDMRKQHGSWKIAKENIQTIDYEPPASCNVSRYSCFGGQCGVNR